MRRLRRILVILLVVGLSFLWGFFAHRESIFPGSLVRDVVHRFRPAPKLRKETRIDRPDADFLGSVPYLSGTIDPEAENTGVVLHEKEKASPGLAFYNSEGESGAYVLDLDGRILHSWSSGHRRWQLSVPLPDGGLLAMVKDKGLLRLDRDSKLLWEFRGRVHHGLHVREDGEIWVLDRRVVEDPGFHPSIPCLLDNILVLLPDGSLKAEHSIADMFRRSRFRFLLPSLELRDFEAKEGEELLLDVFHANHVEVFDGSLAERSPLFARGNVLLSMKNLNTIAIADGRSMEIVWAWGPSDLTRQHYPVLLPNGHILLFNNRTEELGGSQVVEMDPLTDRVVWWHGGFFSKSRGGVQRLPNGNTLITESDRGYVHEVTPDGETVWRFANPDISEKGLRRPIFRMLRFAPGELPFD